MIDRTHELPVSRQCQLLEIGRSSYYYRAVQRQSPEGLLQSDGYDLTKVGNSQTEISIDELKNP